METEEEEIETEEEEKDLRRAISSLFRPSFHLTALSAGSKWKARERERKKKKKRVFGRRRYKLGSVFLPPLFSSAVSPLSILHSGARLSPPLFCRLQHKKEKLHLLPLAGSKGGGGN